METTEDVLIDFGMALVAFGTALQLAGTRLQANRPRAVVPLREPTPVPLGPATSGLPSEGYIRLWDIIGRKGAKGRPSTPGVIPVSRATWYSGIKSGRFPKPIKHGGMSMWRVEDIRALVVQFTC